MPFLEAAPASAPTIDEAILWAIMLCPLVAWGLIVLYVRKLPLAAGYLAILGVGAACLLSYVTLFNVMDANGGIAVHSHEWFSAGDLVVKPRCPGRWSYRRHACGGLNRGVPRPGVLHRLHAGRRRLRALLRPHVPFHGLHARARAGRQPLSDVHLLGARRPLLVLAHRLLVPQAQRRGRGQEGVHRYSHRRPRPARGGPAGLDARRHLRRDRHPGVGNQRRTRRLHRHALRPRVVRGCRRQVGPVPAARLAPRRDGGPDAGVRPHPCRDDGRRRRLPGRPLLPGLRSFPRRSPVRRLGRRHHRACRGDHCPGADRRQASPRLFNHQPARLHDARARYLRVRGRHLPPVHPRVLQGAPLPRQRLGSTTRTNTFACA